MPQETKLHGHEPPRLEGKVFQPQNERELIEAVEFAFDYRGDVTIEMTNGTTVEGYLFNREREVAEPWVQMFPKHQKEVVTILYRDIVKIAFTGEDTAFGKSWEAWLKKNAEQRKAEAARLAKEAAARGHL